MSYFEYDEAKKIYVRTRARPMNQASAEVQQKIARRLRNLIKDNQNLELTDLQYKFVAEVEKIGKAHLAPKINICHQIAISTMLDMIVEAMNGKPILPDDFVHAICTTENEDKKKRIIEFFDELNDPAEQIDMKIKQANKIADLLNESSKNLIPGNSRTNSSIGHHEDPPLIRKGKKFEPTPWSLGITSTFSSMTSCYRPPKERENEDGSKTLQSSSVHAVPMQSYFQQVPGAPKQCTFTKELDTNALIHKRLFDKAVNAIRASNLEKLVSVLERANQLHIGGEVILNSYQEESSPSMSLVDMVKKGNNNEMIEYVTKYPGIVLPSNRSPTLSELHGDEYEYDYHYK